ncbi:PAS domain-containing protein [Prosthecobacter sp.]|uniref:PAS domain-containing protein n=1 Tax=Prosthecobacter sp. TaxID=1965333 RepID=UPI0037847766
MSALVPAISDETEASTTHETFFATLLDQAPGGMYVVDDEFRLIRVNELARHVFEPVEPVIGRDFSEIVRELRGQQRSEHLTRLFRHTLETGERYRSPGAEESQGRNYEWELQRTMLPNGRHGVVCYFSDTTVREQARVEALHELSALRLLQEFSVRLIQQDNSSELHQHILDTAIAIMRADMASIQMYDEGEKTLRLLGWRGFHPLSAAYWSTVGLDCFTSCGQALLQRKRTFINDVEASAKLAGTADLEEFRRSGIRACQTTPLLSRSGRLIGMVSTQWRQPHLPTEDDLRLFDLLARQAADIIERAQAEEALRASENFNRSIVEGSRDCIKVLDLDGKLISMSQRGQELLGIEDFRPFVGQSWVEMWEGAEREAARAAVQVAAAGGSGRMVGRARTLRGEYKWFDVALSPIPEANGAVLRLLASSRDITERRQAELDAQLLAEVSQELTTLDSVEEIVRVVGARLGPHMGLSLFNYVDIDDATGECEVMHAWHRPDVPSSLGRYKLAEYLSPEYQETLRKGEPFVICDTGNDPRTDAQAYEPLRMKAFVCMPLVREGVWRFTLNIHHSEPHVWRAEEIELLRELTTRIWTRLERMRMESALHESEARFRTMANAITHLAWMSRPDGHVFWYNQRWYDYTGKTPEEMEGWGWQNVHDPEILPEVIARWSASVTSGEPFDMTFPVRGADGVFRAFLTRAIPQKDAEGRVTLWFGTLTDISELKRIEATLADRVADLARADRSKDEFLAMLAHELRNPLAPLRNATELLQTAGASAEDQAQALDTISRQIGNMTRMIDDLLDVARITEGRIELRRQPLRLEAVLTAATTLQRSSCAAQQQELTLHLPEEPLFVDGDATRLEQVFGNLLSNACKYSGEGSRISVTAETSTCASTGQPEVIVSVRDDGHGISPELLPHVFDLFVQASRALDRSHGGLGIGLSLVQRLVRLHGGTVEARSAGLGHGSEFIVRLPMLTATPSAPAPAPSPPARRETPRRMLIVDDNTDSACSLAMLQKRRGHETRAVFTGPDALAAAAEFAPEVVLLDIGLPGMDGFEVARQLRSMPSMCGSLLVAMSGYGSHEDRATAAQAGFDEYLVKPLDLGLLRQRLEQHGSGSGAGAAQG